jgi:putative hemolysin
VDGPALSLIALAVLLCLSAFFSGSESALFSLSRTQERNLRERSPGGRLIARMLDEPRKLLVTILLGNLIVNVSATSAATALCLDLFGERGLGIAFAGMSVAILAFGEVIPKAFALRWAERIAGVAIGPLHAFHAVVWPLRVPLTAFSEGFIAFVRRRVGAPKRSFTEEELLTALRIARREGGIEEFQFEVLSNVISFRSKIVREIMTPSVRVLAAAADTPRHELLRRFSESGHSRMPIHGESPDDVIGVLHIKDLIDPQAATSEEDLRSRLREPHFVRETSSINLVYNEMQREKHHVALVLDEYTSFAGLVSTEDILEELVGEIFDARDERPLTYMRFDEDEIVVEGSLDLDEFNEVFGTQLEDPDHETIAGYVMGITGRIPREGEVIEEAGLRFQILRAEPNAIRKMKVERA